MIQQILAVEKTKNERPSPILTKPRRSLISGSDTNSFVHGNMAYVVSKMMNSLKIPDDYPFNGSKESFKAR